MSRLHLSLDEFGRWRVFDIADTKGEFGSWCEADAFRKSLANEETKDEATPAWTPKSGGY